MITEQTNVTEAMILSHPLLAQSGIDTKSLAENPWFKNAMKWLPYLPIALIVIRFLGQQQTGFLLRRIERQLQRLEKKS